MSSVAPTRLSMIVPLPTSRSLNCTLARRLPGVLWSAPVTTNSLPSIMTAVPLRISLARISRYLLCLDELQPVPTRRQALTNFNNQYAARNGKDREMYRGRRQCQTARSRAGGRARRALVLTKLGANLEQAVLKLAAGHDSHFAAHPLLAHRQIDDVKRPLRQ